MFRMKLMTQLKWHIMGFLPAPIMNKQTETVSGFTPAFTAGPWIHTPLSLKYLSVHADSGDPHITRGRICEIECSETLINRSREEIEANARLIAAAPAMFEALQAVIAALTQPVQTSGTTYPETCRLLRADCEFAANTARAALAQAQGKPL